jgi:hypothetical protein
MPKCRRNRTVDCFATSGAELDAFTLAARHRERRAAIGHRMQIEQVIDAVVQGAQRPGAGEVRALARSVEHVRRPEPVEVLVDAARAEGVGPIEALVGTDVGEAQRQRSAQGPARLAKQPVEGNGAADLVAVRQRLDENVRSRTVAGEGPHVR